MCAVQGPHLRTRLCHGQLRGTGSYRSVLGGQGMWKPLSHWETRGLLIPHEWSSAVFLLLVSACGAVCRTSPGSHTGPRERSHPRSGHLEAGSSPFFRKEVPLYMGGGVSLSWAGTYLPWELGARASQSQWEASRLGLSGYQLHPLFMFP